MNYEKMSENDIIKAGREGDNGAMEYILNKYKNYVRKQARALYIVGGDGDDLIQEGMIGLYKAIRDYDVTKDASFMTFASLCINRQLCSAVTASQCQKHMILNTSISFDQPTVNKDGEESYLVNTLVADKKSNPEDILIDREAVKAITDAIGVRLSSFEKDVFDMYMEGVSYVEIAKKMDKTPKSIDNALQRIKGKITNIVSEIKAK